MKPVKNEKNSKKVHDCRSRLNASRDARNSFAGRMWPAGRMFVTSELEPRFFHVKTAKGKIKFRIRHQKLFAFNLFWSAHVLSNMSTATFETKNQEVPTDFK